MNRNEINEYCEEHFPDEEILLLDPPDYDKALVGFGQRFCGSEGRVSFAVYDEDKLLDIIAEEMRESAEEDDDPWTMAREHFDFNVAGGYVGTGTPAFIQVMPGEN